MAFINKDFRFQEKQDKHPRLRWLLFAAGCAVLGVVIANTNTESSRSDAEILVADELPAFTENKPSPETAARLSFQLTLPELQAQQKIIDDINHEPPKQWREFKVKSGDTLAALFKRAGIKPQQLDEMMKSGKAAKQLTRIYPKDILRILTDDDKNLLGLRYEIDHASYLMIERKNGVLEANTFKHEIETRTAHASGTIDSSLFLAGKEAGISQNLIMELAGIFGWDIDFVLDIRKGDSFTVVYEELYHNGEKIKDGNILTAEFVNQGNTYQAVRYTNPETNRSEYFTPDGKSMRKAFLRSPVNFTRISSGFTTRRYHPILHKFRSHKGTDYAAKRGTPIVASGDGKIVHRGRKGGYGRTIIIQHGTKYSTLYAHLNSYKRGLRVGSKVKQGQTIGFLGSSGLASGPHLHYEFRVNGVHRNPLTVKLPTSKPVPKRYRADFELMTTPLLAQLNLLTRTQVALNN
ncbi:MAG: peptidoglycan DD-metalloendopeptidase family protein [Gammaproteobacteria bacterium]|nr:peptidoglycan DD-metalloendopeptidase family protein [Gammaproteobacteria bacterium]MCW8923931.1 peptidoglycan DD-metalloendopeptidase family protein [Gammaproteobacteria bacterium]